MLIISIDTEPFIATEATRCFTFRHEGLHHMLWLKIAAIAAGFTIIDLSYNQLYDGGGWYHIGQGLAQTFGAIPAGVTSLNLYGNYLGGYNNNGWHYLVKKLEIALARIPANVTSLNLGDNILGQKTGEELAIILAAIPAGVTSLDLSNNFLGNHNDEGYKSFYNSKDPGTRYNGGTYYFQSGKALPRVFAAIPGGISILNLAGNQFVEQTSTALGFAFAAIPAGVTTIDLTNNGLNRKTDAGLKAIFAPFVNATKLRKIIIEPEISDRLGKIFTSSPISTKSVMITQAPQSEIQRVFTFISHSLCTQRSTKKHHIDILDITTLMANNQANLMVLTRHLFSEINQHSKDKKLVSSDALFEKIPALKVLQAVLIKALESRQPITNLYRKFVDKDSASMMSDYLLIQLPPKNLQQFISLLCGQQPMREYELVLLEDLICHISDNAKYIDILKENATFRGLFKNNVLWLQDKVQTSSDKAKLKSLVNFAELLERLDSLEEQTHRSKFKSGLNQIHI